MSVTATATDVTNMVNYIGHAGTISLERGAVHVTGLIVTRDEKPAIALDGGGGGFYIPTAGKVLIGRFVTLDDEHVIR